MKANEAEEFRLTKEFYKRNCSIALRNLLGWQEDRITVWIDDSFRDWIDSKSLIPHESPAYYIAWEISRNNIPQSEVIQLVQLVRKIERVIMHKAPNLECLSQDDWRETRLRVNDFLEQFGCSI